MLAQVDLHVQLASECLLAKPALEALAYAVTLLLNSNDLEKIFITGT